MSTSEHVLVLGATGVSGVVFVRYILSLPSSSQPQLTLYVRTRSRLPADIQSQSAVRVVEGALDNPTTLKDAMAHVTAVVSFLGAYMSFYNFITHSTGPTPITDAMPIVCDAMRAQKVTRILALSTPGGFPQEKDARQLSWGWYIKAILLPWIMVPQGVAEMHGIAKVVSQQTDLDWTIFRVPHLNEGEAELEVVPGYLVPDYRGTSELARASLAKWLLKEIGERKWVKAGPMLGNP